MCVKLHPRDLNLGLCLPHPTSVTIALRMCGHSTTFESMFSMQRSNKIYTSKINLNLTKSLNSKTNQRPF